jgi:hypothetical protein
MPRHGTASGADMREERSHVLSDKTQEELANG